MRKEDLLSKLDELLSDDEASSTSRQIFDIAKTKLETQAFDAIDAEDFIERNLSEMKLTSGKKLSQKEDMFYRRLLRGGLGLAKNPVFGKKSGLEALQEVPGIFREIQEEKNKNEH
ncbi:hypothetical protein [Lactococcus termiticola]|uniref:Uncharacterized protein n=1 Tax=Lactococcus termiticola TaxID=2169526 RepID=A0A2R5HHK7_9LACT|nr:hypothetical protein [Lactococcus termiticola]GBG96835.1 hypothetical protein NtB2_00960 [Lactococcus termiticola]